MGQNGPNCSDLSFAENASQACHTEAVEGERMVREEVPLLTEYIDKAMEHACYERLEDGTYCGEIPGFAGLWACGQTP